MFILVATVLATFDIGPAPGEKLVPEFTFGLTRCVAALLACCACPERRGLAAIPSRSRAASSRGRRRQRGLSEHGSRKALDICYTVSEDVWRPGSCACAQ